MTLKLKIVLAIAAVMMLSTLGSITAITLIFFPSYAQLDRDMALRRADRVEKTFASEAASLESANRDWAQWDDTYYFARDHRPEYISKNLKPEDLANIKVDVMAIADRRGRILFRAPRDKDGILGKAFRTDAASPFAFPHPSSIAKSDGVVSGFAFIGKIPVIVSVGTIMTSERKGPSPGDLVFVRELTPALLAELSTRAGAAFRILPAPEASVAGMSGNTSGIYMAERDSDIRTMQFAADLTEGRAFAIGLSGSREFSALGEQMVVYTAIVLAIVGVLLCAFGAYLAVRMVASPLSRIVAHMQHIGESASFDQPLDLARDDEIGVVAKGLNAMLAKVRGAQSAEKAALAKLADRNTALKDALRTADMARAEAQSASRAKSAFLSNVSHELRTPLNAIIGFSELVGRQMRGPINQHYLDYVKEINKAGNNLLGLINQILDVSRLEIGRIALERSAMDASDAVDHVAGLFRDFAEKSHVQVDFVPAGEPAYISADRSRFQQILSTLLHNAIRFSTPGSSVKLEIEATQESVAIAVTDNGPGMSKEQVEAATRPFHQGEDTWARSHGGLGLGLGLAKGLTELHGAHFEIHSQLDRGTTVRIRFPRVSEPAQAAEDSRTWA